MDWAEAPFIEYLNAVDEILEQRYGVTSDDTGLAMIAAGQEEGMEPDESAETIASKNELIEIQQGGIKCDKESRTTSGPAMPGCTSSALRRLGSKRN